MNVAFGLIPSFVFVFCLLMLVWLITTIFKKDLPRWGAQVLTFICVFSVFFGLYNSIMTYGPRIEQQSYYSVPDITPQLVNDSKPFIENVDRIGQFDVRIEQGVPEKKE